MSSLSRPHHHSAIKPQLPARAFGTQQLMICCSIVISVFAIVILSVLGALFNASHHSLMDSNDDPKDGPVVAGTAFAAVGVYGVGALFSSPFVMWCAVVSMAAASRGLYDVVLRGGDGVGWRCMGKTGGKGSGLGVHKANDHAVLPRVLRPSSMAACARV